MHARIYPVVAVTVRFSYDSETVASRGRRHIGLQNKALFGEMTERVCKRGRRVKRKKGETRKGDGDRQKIRTERAHIHISSNAVLRRVEESPPRESRGDCHR